MKKNMIVGATLAIAILTTGAVSAFAAGSCCDGGKCVKEQAALQTNQDTAKIASAIKAKEVELRGLYGYDSFDSAKVSALENDIKNLKGQLHQAADHNGVPSCCQS
ncbi:hypothetical protein L4X63_18505 [Geomonas sp. Red32]|uniref:hypothetical protein n=1 Tax=Geomonas sp. Red32 TaxID=2912856 RepID=UPI00202D045E|nr:hypothetical protein [Geomonas sp. Red32]MCM0083581.1 hypothetical protein [Geomonas sp. Red32]